MNYDKIKKEDELWLKVKVERKDIPNYSVYSILVKVPHKILGWVRPSDLHEKPKEIKP